MYTNMLINEYALPESAGCPGHLGDGTGQEGRRPFHSISFVFFWILYNMHDLSKATLIFKS